MGYSLSVPCRSVQAAKQLHSFLEISMRPYSVLTGDLDHLYDPTQYINIGRGLSYGSGASKVGFNFSSQGPYGIYMHAVLSWAALRVGRKRALNALAVTGYAHQMVPYITYDNEPIPVLTVQHLDGWSDEAKDYARLKWQVDHFGMRLSDCSPLGSPRNQCHHDVTRGEMRRLDHLWNVFMDRETR